MEESGKENNLLCLLGASLARTARVWNSPVQHNFVAYQHDIGSVYDHDGKRKKTTL